MTNTIPYRTSDYLGTPEVIVQYLILVTTDDDPSVLEVAMYEVIEALMNNNVRV